MFALGAANGKFNLDNKFWVILFFGNRTAIVFLFAFTYFDNLEFFFLLSTNVKGPGQNFLYNLLKVSFTMQSCFKSLIL